MTTGQVNPAAIDRLMRIVESERDGDHFLSHWCLARKVLGESPAFAIRVGNAFSHRRLTREECEGMVSDWLEDSADQGEGDRG